MWIQGQSSVIFVFAFWLFNVFQAIKVLLTMASKNSIHGLRGYTGS